MSQSGLTKLLGIIAEQHFKVFKIITPSKPLDGDFSPSIYSYKVEKSIGFEPDPIGW